MPKMTHPDSPNAIEVPSTHVEMYASQGWEPAKSPAAKSKK